MGEEVEDAHTSPSTSAGSSKGHAEPVTFRGVNPDISKQEADLVTPWADFNSVLSTAGGFVKGQVTVMAASPGVGKSTLCTELCGDDALYISSEESYEQVNARFVRVNPDSGCDILSTTSAETAYAAIEQTSKKFIIIDSLNNLEFGSSYQRTAKIAQTITSLIKESGKIGIIISQVTKKGDVAGMNSIEHVVDTVLFLEKSAVSSNVIAVCRKNRFGEVGSVAVFEHTAGGFLPVEEAGEECSGIGSTVSTVLFGFKRMKVAVDALTADAVGARTMQRSNGYSISRVQQIIAVLDYHGKLGIGRDKDTYVSVSQGLTVTDTDLDLAVANSILSSFFENPVVSEASGEISLNGRVRGGSADGKPVEHVRELIAMYAKGV